MKNNSKLKTQTQNLMKGFTLVEAIVTIGIMTILITLSLASYSSYRQKNALKRAAEEVRSALVEASNMALAPTEEGTLGYGIYLNTLEEAWLFQDKKGTSPDEYTNTKLWNEFGLNVDNKIKTINLPSNIAISGFSPSASFGSPCSDSPGSPQELDIVFAVPPQIPDGKEIFWECEKRSGTGTITLSHTKTSETKRIKVDLVSGNVEIE